MGGIMIKFSKDHAWVRLEGDIAVCGITDYAQKQLKDIVYIEMPEKGKKSEKWQRCKNYFAHIREDKANASKFYSPDQDAFALGVLAYRLFQMLFHPAQDMVQADDAPVGATNA